MSDLRQAVDPRSLLYSRLDRGSPAVRRPLLTWGTRDRKTRIVFWVLVALATCLALVIGAGIIGDLLGAVGAHADTLFLFWTWSKFLHAVASAALIYDPHALFAFERSIITRHAHYLPFAYPPSMLLLIWPLALLRPAIALPVWFGVSLAAYVGACWRRPGGPLIATLAVVSPSTLAALYYGQVSLLVAACIIGGCRLVGRRPILAGVLFGLAAVKPQIGLLVPVALISARQWRSVIAAATTVGLTVVASSMAFGWTTWARLPAALATVSGVVAQRAVYDTLSPTVSAACRLLGAGPALTDAAQLIAAVATVGVIWIVFRRGFTSLGVAALAVGAFFVTPYAVYYDLPLASYAVLAVVIERHESRASFGTGELCTLILAIALPVLMLFHPFWWPWGIGVPALLFGLILRRRAARGRDDRALAAAAFGRGSGAPAVGV